MVAVIKILLGLSAITTPAVGAAVGSPDANPDRDFVYADAYRLRIAINDDYASASSAGADDDYQAVLPQVREKPYYWLAYKAVRSSSQHPGSKRAIAVAQRGLGGHAPRRAAPVFYEQLERVGDGETWRSWTDAAAGRRRLTFDIQYLDEFEPRYPAEHGVYLTSAAAEEGDYAVGAAPTRPPQMWGLAPGTFLVCAGRRIDGEGAGAQAEVLAIRFAYTVLNETAPARLPRGCVPVRLEARCAPLDPPVRNSTWDHERLLEVPCVWDRHRD